MSPAEARPEELQAKFVEDYCPPLDTATLLAILQDYDVADISQFEAARQVLDVIKESAAAEEATGFDPSGSSWAQSSLPDNDALGFGDEGSNSARSLPCWTSETDDTSISHGVSLLDLEERDELGNVGTDSHDLAFVGLDEQSRKSHLGAIFPALRPFDIEWVLKKYKGDAGLAIDELMTQSFLEESGTRRRGVEAFSENDSIPRSRKGKGKKKRARWGEDKTISPRPTSPTAASSKWETGRMDIDFVSSRTGMPLEQVSSIYYENGASIKSTIFAIINAHAALKIESDDDAIIRLHAYQLNQRLPSIPLSDLIIIVQITHPNEVSAQELANALVTPPNNIKPNIQLDFRHAPIDLDNGFISSVPSKIKSPSSNFVSTDGPRIPMDAAKAAALATTYRSGRDQAFVQASAAYHRGKSDHLMGGAAAYYSEVGRDYDFRAKSAQSAAADALVAGQSSRTELDLHGVNVKDAVRISRERVTAWWHSLGDSRFSGRAGSFKIVTGLGNHSKEGRARLGPAVGKMLIREGWKVEIGQGALLVTGVAQSPALKRK